MFSTLLGQELKANYRIIFHSKPLLEKISEINDNSSCSIQMLSTGSKEIQLTVDSGSIISFVPECMFNYYDKLIVELVQVNEEKYVSVELAYQQIRVYNSYFRATSLVLSNELKGRRSGISALAKLYNSGMHRRLEKINEAYKNLTGKELTLEKKRKFNK